MSHATVSSLSSDLSYKSSCITCCRICQDGRSLEKLISPCKCAGTMAYVHSSCLEKWLSQTARNRCELCHHDFKTVVTPKTFRDWLLTFQGQYDNERRYMYIDSACFFILTPLGIISAWLCVQGAVAYYNDNHFWTGFGLIMLTGFLMMMYLVWICVTIRYHFLTYNTWRIEHGCVRLVFSNHDNNNMEWIEMDEQTEPGAGGPRDGANNNSSRCHHGIVPKMCNNNNDVVVTVIDQTPVTTLNDNDVNVTNV